MSLYSTGQSVPTPEMDFALKSMSPNRAEERPQKFVLPPTAKQRGHIHSVPGAVVNGISRSQTPCVYSASMKPMTFLRSAGSPNARNFMSQGMRWLRKSFVGSSRRPALIAHTLRPASVSVLIAMPPPAPVPITATSNTFVFMACALMAPTSAAADARVRGRSCAGTPGRGPTIAARDCRAPCSRLHSSRSPSP